jgi:UPF0271 protein
MMVKQQAVISRDAVRVPVQADTVCLHGDGEHALEFARRLRDAFREQDILVSAG